MMFYPNLDMYGPERPAPEFLSPVPIRKTRAGLQFTCAAPTLPPKGQPPDVWVRIRYTSYNTGRVRVELADEGFRTKKLF